MTLCFVNTICICYQKPFLIDPLLPHNRCVLALCISVHFNDRWPWLRLYWLLCCRAEMNNFPTGSPLFHLLAVSVTQNLPVHYKGFSRLLSACRIYMHLNTNQGFSTEVVFLQLKWFTCMLSCQSVLLWNCALQCHLVDSWTDNCY